MDGSLEDYRRKRNFAETPEPAAGKPRNSDFQNSANQQELSRFVIHRHEARQLHYDLRLEIDGVLCSWAVPKGFSFEPKDKRLAVRTEDHPMEYEHFDGVIPKGQYGAGTMRIWDHGTYYAAPGTASPNQAVDAGELKIILRGRRLRGEWHIVKTQGGPNHWLLFKSKDRYAGTTRDSVLGIDLHTAEEGPWPKQVSRKRLVDQELEQAATASLLSDPNWLFEADLAGLRLFAEKQGDQVRLQGLSATPPVLQLELRQLGAENALVDGVLVALDEGGRPSREVLEQALKPESENHAPATLQYYAFDLLYFDQFDLRKLPTLQRKTALRHILPASQQLLFVDHVVGQGQTLLNVVKQAGLSGMVAKHATATYQDETEATDWLRIPSGSGSTDLSTSIGEALASQSKTSSTSENLNRVRVTHRNKVFWPEQGHSKGNLIDYYESVAEFLLPYLHQRPVHLNRFPDGIEGESFYQREAKNNTPKWLSTHPIPSESKGYAVPHLVCNDRDSLRWMINTGTIDLHPWLSKAGSLEQADWTVLDLDPKQAPFQHVVRIARAAGKLLRGLGLRPYLKTSGSTGLHIYVPLEPGYTYDQSRMFCEAVARALARELKDVSTVERHIANREGKVYLDYGQNRAGQTLVPPYAVRPVPNACVSAPLHWDELDFSLAISNFTIENMRARIEQHGDLFRGTLDDRQSLVTAIEQFENVLR